MKWSSMFLKIYLPYKVFIEVDEVSSITLETSVGQLGILPNRLDCTAIVREGILVCRDMNGHEKYFALDRGVMVKQGKTVSISVREAVGGTDIGKLYETIKQEYLKTNKSEENMKHIIMKMESGLIKGISRLRL
jgi:F-type H+-transporting ATPase subunit epsilon